MSRRPSDGQEDVHSVKPGDLFLRWLRARLFLPSPRTIRGILISLLLIVLVPLVLVEAGLYYQKVEQRRAQEFQANLELARAVAVTFDGYVQNILNYESAIGATFALPQPLRDQHLQRLLDIGVRQHPSIICYSWLSAEGQITASSEPKVIGLSMRNRTYFREIAQGREWIVGSMVPERVSNKLTFVIAKGIRDNAGVLQGVVSGLVNTEHLDEALGVERFGQGTISLIDPQGRAVFSYPNLEQGSDQRNWLAINPAIGRALAGEEATATIDISNGQKRIASYTPIRSIGWAVDASRPEAEAMSTVIQEHAHDFGFLLLVAAVSLLVAFVMSRSITSPIRHLEKLALALSHGRLDHKLEIAGPVELERLGDVFNRMAQAIEIRTRAMELVFDTIGTVSSADNLDNALHELASQLAQAIGVASCHIAMFARDDRYLVVRASYSSLRPGPSPFLGHAFSVDDVAPSRQVRDEKRCIEIPDPESDLLNQAERERWKAVGLKAGLGVPLLAQDRVVGILGLGDVKSRVFTEDEKRLCMAVATQALVAIEKADLYRQMALERERLEAIIRNTSDGILLIDGQRRVMSINPALENHTGWTSEEVRGRPCSEVFRSRDRNGVSLCETACPMQRAMSSGAPVPYAEVTITTKDGQSRDLSVSYVYIPSPSTQTGYCVAIGRDISNVKAVEKLKDEFVSLLSHDLRAPLTIIWSQAQLIQRFIGRADLVHNSSDTIVDSCRRMEAMIKDLVDSARLESGQLRIEKQPLNLWYFTSRLLERARTMMDVGRIEMKIPADLPSIGADQDRLERILMNLLTNALKYSPPETTVLVMAESVDREVVVSVADHGVGMAPEDLSHIFERYYRADGIRKAEGLGLGLYITRMLVELHGGRIWAQSQLDKGSTFYFTMPLA